MCNRFLLRFTCSFVHQAYQEFQLLSQSPSSGNKGGPQHKPLIFEHQMIFALSTYPTSTFFVLSFSIIASAHTYLRSTSTCCFAYLLFSTVSSFISIVALPNISWSWCSFSENLFNPSFKTGFTPVEDLHVSELFVRLKVSIQLKICSRAYMQKTCDVAEKAILAKKKLRKKCVNRNKM